MRYSSVHQILLPTFVLWFGSYAYLYIYEFSGFKPLYSYLLLLGYFVFWVLIRRNLQTLSDKGIQSLILWLGLYWIYGCLAFFNSSQSVNAIQTIITLGEAILLLGVFTLMFSEQFLVHRIQKVFAMLAVLSIVINCYDFAHPILTSVPGRAAGLYVNPNIAGQFIAMAMVAGVTVLPRHLRLMFVLVCGLGVLLTFSRGAWILWGLGMVWLGGAGVIIKACIRFLLVASASVIALGLIAFLFSGELGAILEQTGLSDYLDANTRARLGMTGSQLSDYAAQTRILLIWESIQIGKEAPIFGHGLGYTNEWRLPYQPHNMYLLFWVEGGLIGLLFYAGLMLLLLLNSVGIGKILVAQLIVAGMFTHNQLEQPVFLMFTAFAVAHQAMMRYQRQCAHTASTCSYQVICK